MALSRSRRPNILLVVIDCARSDHCSVHGYHRSTTPFLERLAAEGVVYDQAISPAGWSLPTHASLFTGMYPSKHGAHDENHFLDSSVPTLAETLRQGGYQTMAFCGNPWVGKATGLDRGFAIFDDLRPRGFARRSIVGRGLRKARRVITGTGNIRADLTTKLAREAIHELSQGSEPFFLFVHYNEPHTPRQLPRREAAQFFGTRYTWEDAVPLSRDVNAYIAGAVHWSEKDLNVFTALYDAALWGVDKRIAQLVEGLRRAGVLDETMVIVTADHGENLGEHGLLGHKLCLYDTLLRVPLVVRYPGASQAGTRVAEPVQTIDLTPTIYEITGLGDHWEGGAGCGASLLGSERPTTATFAEQARPNLAVFTEKYPNFDVRPHDRRLRTVRSHEWKFIWSSDGRHELYNLRHDPGELQNLMPDRPDVARELHQRLDEWSGSFQTATATAGEVEFDEVVTERLRALGYIP